MTVQTIGRDRAYHREQNVWRRIVHAAWDYSPLLAVRMTQRLKVNTVKHEVERLVKTHPEKARAVPEALPIFIGEKLDPAQRPLFRVRYPLRPVTALV